MEIYQIIIYIENSTNILGITYYFMRYYNKSIEILNETVKINQMKTYSLQLFQSVKFFIQIYFLLYSVLLLFI